MKWLDFFFGWLIKSQYEQTLLDGIIFFIELIIVFLIFSIVKDLIEKKKQKEKQ